MTSALFEAVTNPDGDRGRAHVVTRQHYLDANYYADRGRDHVITYNYRHVTQMFDSSVETTRIYWRERMGVAAEQARDPRPFCTVLSDPPAPNC